MAGGDPDDGAAATPDVDSIQRWLVARVAQRLKVPSTDVDASAPFTAYGMSSMVALSISGELEEWLGFPLAPTLMWDYPTIESLARHLAAEARKARGDGGS